MSFDTEMVLRLVLAAFLGGIVGAEREMMHRSAGLRTHALVSTSSALLIIVSTYGFMHALAPGRIVLDPSRVAAQVVSGIGFLGAGIIIFRKNAVRGLTTAASVWAVAAIGLAVGAGLYVIGIAATAIYSVILTTLKSVERKIFPQRTVTRLTIDFDAKAFCPIYEKVSMAGVELLSTDMRSEVSKHTSTLKLELVADDKVLAELFQALKFTEGVHSVCYTGTVLPAGECSLDELEEEDSQSEHTE